MFKILIHLKINPLHVNNIISRKINYFRNKKVSEKSDSFNFATLFNVWLNRRLWMFISASAVDLLWYVVLVEVHEENSTSC